MEENPPNFVQAYAERSAIRAFVSSPSQAWKEDSQSFMRWLRNKLGPEKADINNMDLATAAVTGDTINLSQDGWRKEMIEGCKDHPELKETYDSIARKAPAIVRELNDYAQKKGVKPPDVYIPAPRNWNNPDSHTAFTKSKGAIFLDTEALAADPRGEHPKNAINLGAHEINHIANNDISIFKRVNAKFNNKESVAVESKADQGVPYPEAMADFFDRSRRIATKEIATQFKVSPANAATSYDKVQREESDHPADIDRAAALRLQARQAAANISQSMQKHIAPSGTPIDTHTSPAGTSHHKSNTPGRSR